MLTEEQMQGAWGSVEKHFQDLVLAAYPKANIFDDCYYRHTSFLGHVIRARTSQPFVARSMSYLDVHCQETFSSWLTDEQVFNHVNPPPYRQNIIPYKAWFTLPCGHVVTIDQNKFHIQKGCEITPAKNYFTMVGGENLFRSLWDNGYYCAAISCVLDNLTKPVFQNEFRQLFRHKFPADKELILNTIPFNKDAVYDLLTYVGRKNHSRNVTYTPFPLTQSIRQARLVFNIVKKEICSNGYAARTLANATLGTENRVVVSVFPSYDFEGAVTKTTQTLKHRNRAATQATNMNIWLGLRWYSRVYKKGFPIIIQVDDSIQEKGQTTCFILNWYKEDKKGRHIVLVNRGTRGTLAYIEMKWGEWRVTKWLQKTYNDVTYNDSKPTLSV